MMWIVLGLLLIDLAAVARIERLEDKVRALHTKGGE